MTWSERWQAARDWLATQWEALAAAVPASWHAELISASVLVLAILGGLLTFTLLRRLAGRLRTNGFASSRLLRAAARARGPLRLASVVAAVGLAAPWVADQTEVSELARRLATLSVIALMGWTSLVVLRAYADLAERRYRIDVEDNLLARKHHTQFQVLRRAGLMVILVVTVSAMLMTFPAVRDFGISLFASAGVAGIVIGIAARPVLANLIAGLQIALTQPIRIEDAVVVEGEWGWIEAITATYVVIRVWDWRRLIIPLSYFIEKPFQNWTREAATIMGSVFWYLDYTAPVQQIREKVEEVARESELWDGRVVNLQVVDTTPETIKLRALVSARNSPRAWDLRCEVREKVTTWLQAEHPAALPKTRAEVLKQPADSAAAEGPMDAPAPAPARAAHPEAEAPARPQTHLQTHPAQHHSAQAR